jgi:diguanylate cyclase (GGDEF)-like protein/PAS domain S-box-containing protein
MSTPWPLALAADAEAGFDGGEFERRFARLEQELGLAYENVPFGSHSLTTDGVFAQVNALELAWLGERLDALVGKQRFVDFLTPQSQVAFRRRFFSTVANGHFEDLALDLVGKDGTVRPVSLSSVGIKDGAGVVVKHRAVMFDMTQARWQDMKTRIAASAFESLSGMFITDRHGVFIQVNKSFTALTGYSEADVIGRTGRALGLGQQDEAFYRRVSAALLNLGSWEGEVSHRRKNGDVCVGWLNLSAVYDTAGDTARFVGSFIDITANKAAEAAINRLAYFDPLTQLPNRKLMFDRIHQALISSQRSGLGGAVVFIDLDDFKSINDTRGHAIGDLLLIELASRLQSAVREGDSVGRQSGDEFLMLLIGLSPDVASAAVQARHVCDKIQLALNRPYRIDGHDYHCTASIGIDQFAPAATVDSLLQHADMAMYQSKKDGRNRVSFFDQAMQNKLLERFTLEEQLRKGLALRQFELHFQPQVDHDGQVLGAEVLLRWSHPERGLVPPLEFIAVAEETGLILAIGQWVLESACTQLKAWERQAWTRSLQLAVNVSARQFRQENFVAQVQQAIGSSRVNPARLKLEITESILIDLPDTSAKMAALKALGVGFSMDDFGTGYSSLSSLSRLPLSQLKIDQSFVRNMDLQAVDAIIVQTIIVMAHALNMEVMAEGVETPAQRDFLALHGCRMYQGYLFGRPMPVAAFEAMLLRASERSADDGAKAG